MNETLLYFRIALVAIISGFVNTNVKAQDVPFNCDYSAYLFQYNDVYAIDLASGSSYQVATDITSGNINATGYNSTDGYIWGSLTSPSKTIVRIGANFQTTTYYINELPVSNRYIGDVSLDGVYYLKGGGTTYYKIDVNPESNNYGQHMATENLSQGLSIHDWAFNAVDGYLYTVEKNTNILYRIDPANGSVISLGEVPILSGLNYTYGAVYFDVSGRFYVSANQTGTIYAIQNVQDLTGSNAMNSNLFAFGPSSASNDGARCPTAPVPQEICDNGIDDDGDGLIDCEDPSCSGYGSCAVIDPEAPGANDGGLESNNRLSEAINKRNYNRSKTNYSFDRKTAPQLRRTTSYGMRNSTSDFSLEDFIPIGVINEESVIDVTPNDLIDITNATDVYGVDYMSNQGPIASILALKTEDGIYEHTKYICDRLLGAELIMVSTITINDQPFIKALIKNIDGTVEFVLSLSAKLSEDDTNFRIDSHWNLDNYENDVTYYNFQIWASSLDDLYLLGQEVLDLLEVERPIVSYSISEPPTVFVRKGSYANGMLDLEIVNTNVTDIVQFDGNVRDTETSDFEAITTDIDLLGQYISFHEINVGPMFDIGFRISDGIHTADDLFLSDGPWGIDDSEASTTIDSYEVLPNTEVYEDDELPVERNVYLEASTRSYVSIYRALTPRFQPVDVTAYKTFQFNAKGTGDLEVTFVRQSIDVWEDQYRETVTLTDSFQEFTIALDNAVLDDVVTVVFKMSSDGMMQSKEVAITEVRFKDYEALSTTTVEAASRTTIINYPNPFSGSTTIQLPMVMNDAYITVVDMLGCIVDEQTLSLVGGKSALYEARQLTPGVYSYTVTNNINTYSGKFIIK